ncbi:MAG: HEAT repeat domain-containing protein [Dokdonella sp.]
MKQFTIKALVLGAILLSTAGAHALAASDLQTQVKQVDGWVAWRVPMTAEAGSPCCYVWKNKSLVDAGCDLDGQEWSFGSDDQHPLHDSTLAVYVRIAQGHVDRVRAVAASCPVKSAHPIRWIDTVEPVQSVNLLSVWLGGAEGSPPDDDSMLAALAYHADASATRALAALAEPAHTRKSREQALFWLGQSRGADGADIIERYATTDADPDVREKAIFALTQSHAGDPYASIQAISRSDPATHVRSQALFWMAQMEDARAAADITAALQSEHSDDVREQAVFALSQLKDGEAEDALIAVVRGNYPREVKKQALFWLGQSESPRAMQALDDVLAKSTGVAKVTGH